MPFATFWFLFRGKFVPTAFLVLPVLMISGTGVIWAKDTIIFQYSCMPPYFICEENDVSGILIDIENLIMNHLPEYELKRIKANIGRKMQNMKTDGPFCASSIIKTEERERFLAFSLPIFISPPQVLFMRHETWKALGQTRVLSLTDILKDRTLKLGITSRRIYGPELDPIIRQNHGKPHIHTFNSPDYTRQLMELLLARRIDYAISTPFEVEYIKRRMNIDEEIAIVSIQEKTTYILAHIACPKTEWGVELINKINPVIRKISSSPPYFEIFEPWIGKDRTPEYRKEFLRLIANPAPTSE